MKSAVDEGRRGPGAFSARSRCTHLQSALSLSFVNFITTENITYLKVRERETDNEEEARKTNRKAECNGLANEEEEEAAMSGSFGGIFENLMPYLSPELTLLNLLQRKFSRPGSCTGETKD